MGKLVGFHEAERQVAACAGLTVEDLPLIVGRDRERYISWFDVTVNGDGMSPARRVVEDVSHEAPATLMTARYALKYLEAQGAVPYVGGAQDVYIERSRLLTPYCVALNGLAIRAIAEGTYGWDVEALEETLGVRDLCRVPDKSVGILESYEEIDKATSGCGRILTYYESPYRPGVAARVLGRMMGVRVDSAREYPGSFQDAAMVRYDQAA